MTQTSVDSVGHSAVPFATYTAWEETITKRDLPPAVDKSATGYLMQIYPLVFNRQLVELEATRFTVGRDPSAGLCIADSSISRQHALIERTPEGYRITDLASTNGTWVNEHRVESSALEPGDRVQLGGFIFKFLSSNHIELEYHEAVYTMMTRDGLTGTYNKRSFLEFIDREFRKSQHRGTPLSLILFDIDHFKQVNDTHGHLAGDEVLREIGKRLGSVVADHDFLSRYGGEEFAILLAGVPLPEAREVAERCRVAVETEAFCTSVGPLLITISVGVAEFAGLADPQQPEQLIQAADGKLYEAKRSGRNRVCC